MITEEYVSVETAKLLKEKGFDAPCFAYYYVIPHKTVIAYDTDFPKNSDLCLIYANMEFGSLPTLQMAMKWLREVHEIQCFPVYRQSDYYEPQIFCLGEWINDKELDGCFSYEQACEEAIKYCLENLI